MNNTVSNEMNNFFLALAERKHNENDLSDITYALCKANDEFRKFWLKYCFEDDIDTEDLIREYQDGFSRPDFFFNDLNNQERIIEVKIYDWNQHFEQYEKKFPNAKYAFIANYLHDAVPNWKIKTWKSFCEALEQSELCKNEIINGYIQYLKVITDIKEYKKMNLNQSKDLPSFIENLKVILSNNYNFGEYNQSKPFNKEFYGQFFYKGSNDKKIYFWIGLYLPESNVYIGFKDDDTWVSDNIRKNIRKISKSKTETDFFWSVENNDGNFGDFWFGMKKSDLLFDDKESADSQKQVLKEFITDVFKSIKADKYLE